MGQDTGYGEMPTVDLEQQAEEHGRRMLQSCPSCDGEIELGPWLNAWKDQRPSIQAETDVWWYRVCPKCQYQWAEWKLVRYGRLAHE
jgi:hypothetical protein